MRDQQPASSILDLKLLNTCAWLAVIIAYIMPFRQNGTYQIYGYPFGFITAHKNGGSITALISNNFNLFAFTLDVLVMYIAGNLLLRRINYLQEESI